MSRQYTVCTTKTCDSWIFTDRIAKLQQPCCAKCGKAWPGAKAIPGAWWAGAPKGGRVWRGAQTAAPAAAPGPSQPRPKNKIVKTLGTLWDTLTPEAKTEFQKAGYQPPKPTPEEPDLISLLQIHAKNLPEAVREALPPPAPTPEPDPVQDGLEKGNALRKAVMKLRDLGQRKLKLQGEIDASKTHLRELLKRLQSLQSDIAEATEAVKKRSQEYEPVLESADDEPNNVDLVLQALGLEEAALTDDQKRKIDALREGAKKRKLPDEADEDMKPPGLPEPAAMQQGGSRGPENKPTQSETEPEGANPPGSKARSRSRGRTSQQG